METSRYEELNEMGIGLTKEEVAKGWHFCCDWDFLLVGPGMQEALACQCQVKPIVEWQNSKEGQQMMWDIHEKTKNTDS